MKIELEITPLAATAIYALLALTSQYDLKKKITDSGGLSPDNNHKALVRAVDKLGSGELKGDLYEAYEQFQAQLNTVCVRNTHPTYFIDGVPV